MYDNYHFVVSHDSSGDGTFNLTGGEVEYGSDYKM